MGGEIYGKLPWTPPYLRAALMQYGPVSRIRNTHNNFCICPQMTMDYDLEEKLHDIDEFIESELGFPPLSARGTLSPAEINNLSFFLQSSDFSNGYHPGNNPGKIIFVNLT